jgi:glycosyltransferase involved in cell wall biosynthesis
MRIGIDAHTLGSKSSGNESYYLQLLQELARIEANGDRYVIYFARPNSTANVPKPDHFRFKRIRPLNPFVRIPLSFPVEFQREKLDVFHAQFIIPPFCKSRRVATIPDILFERYPDFFPRFETLRSKLLIRWSARRADHVITVSNFSKTEIVNTYHIDPDMVSVTYEAAGAEFRPLDKEKSQEQIAKKYGVQSPFILYVGRLQARKNVLRLVEAYARLAARGVNEKLIVVGKQDWGAEEVTARVAQLNLSGRVIFTGYVEGGDLPIFYNAAELFVFPSICEGFGIPVLEAMACGVPVVTSYGSSLEEVAGGAAILAHPESVDSIAEALDQVLSNEGLKQLLRQRGLKRASEFSGASMAAQTISIYRKVLSRSY